MRWSPFVLAFAAPLMLASSSALAAGAESCFLTSAQSCAAERPPISISDEAGVEAARDSEVRVERLMRR